MKKMRWVFVLSVVALIISSPCRAQEWAWTYGGSHSDSDCSVEPTSDGGYIVVGRTYSFGMGSADFWVLKLNSDGTVAWEKTYGGTGQDWAASVQETFNDLGSDGYVVVGTTDSFEAVGQDIWLLKLNPDGTIAWQKMFDLGVSELARCVRQTSDGGYIVGGYTAADAGIADAWIVKLRSDGSVEWEKTYGGEDWYSWDIVSSLTPTSEGGYVVAGETDSFGAGNVDMWILKLSESGSVVWENAYGGIGLDRASDIQETVDGGFVVAGETKTFGVNDTFDIWVLKLSSDGTVEWQKTFGGSEGNDTAQSVRETTEGAFIVAGTTDSFGAGGWDLWLLQLDSNGALQWEKTYGGGGWDTHPSIRQTPDGGHVLSGYTKSFGVDGGAPWSGWGDIWVLKLDASGGIPECSAIGTSEAIFSNTTIEAATTTAVVLSTEADINDPGATDQVSQAEVFAICGAEAPVIDKIGNRQCYPAEKIRIMGAGFGQTQGNSLVHIGNETFDENSPKIKIWSDILVKVKIPNYKCSWFKGEDHRKRKVWVTVGGMDTNIKRIKVFKPDTCQ